MSENVSEMYRAIHSCQLFVFRARRDDPKYAETHTAIEVYNDWVSSRGFSLHDENNVIALLDHIGELLKMPLMVLGQCLVYDCVIPQKDLASIEKE